MSRRFLEYLLYIKKIKNKVHSTSTNQNFYKKEHKQINVKIHNYNS